MTYYSQYFNSLGYKYLARYHKLIVQDFQRHAGIVADGIIGPITKGKIDFYNKGNFCPEVFKPIKPYRDYNDVEIEAVMKHKLKGLGAVLNRCAKDNDFDVLHSIAHAGLESAWGTSYIARMKNNLYGWAAYDSSPVKSAAKFKSFAESIEMWSAKFNRLYLLPTGKYYHGNNEHGVNVRYASSPIAGVNKAFIVRDLRKQLGR